MISSEVQRTLVKSPPELWAELSDPESLARHLGELGEIRITKTKPEQSVEWEAEAAKGKVELKPSGWGTKVTLSVTVESPQTGEHQPVVEEEPVDAEPVDAEPVDAEPVDEEPEPETQVVEPAPKLGFFARLFKRKARSRSVEEPLPVDPEPDPPALEEPAPEQTALEEPALEEEPAPGEPEATTAAADLAAELAEAEEAIAAQTTELLTAVLDRLGAAHHRPFSRA